MKKLLAILILLLPFFGNAQTNDLYAPYIGTNDELNSNFGIAAFNPTSCDVSYITAFTNEKFYGFGEHAVDPLHHAFFQIVGDSINNYLMSFDMNTGALNNILFVVDSVGSGLPGTTTISSNIIGPFYNCVDDKIYFFHSKAHSQDYIHFARVARTTGIVEELNSFPAFIWPPSNVVTPTHQYAYFFKCNNPYNIVDQVVTLDLANNTSAAATLSTSMSGWWIWELTYNVADGMLYGLQEDLYSYSMGNAPLPELRFMKLNPQNGAVTYLTPGFSGFILVNEVAVDFNTNQLCAVVDYQTSPNNKAIKFDISGGTYSVSDLSFSGFAGTGNSVIGFDSYYAPKGCFEISSTDNLSGDCNDPVSTVLTNENTALYFGCHWKDYSGMQLTIYDEWGRRISDQKITKQLTEISMSDNASQMYFYSITDDGEMKASGKVMVAR